MSRLQLPLKTPQARQLLRANNVPKFGRWVANMVELSEQIHHSPNQAAAFGNVGVLLGQIHALGNVSDAELAVLKRAAFSVVRMKYPVFSRRSAAVTGEKRRRSDEDRLAQACDDRLEVLPSVAYSRPPSHGPPPTRAPKQRKITVIDLTDDDSDSECE